ncbi:MAG: preprotein translocase subunit SecE [Planctomycetota bacterium]
MDVYKSGEGKIARRVAFYFLLALVVWGFKVFATWVQKFDFAHGEIASFVAPFYRQPFNVGVLIAIVLTIAGGFVLFRWLNRPQAADLLIDTETEMKKVHWPAWLEARQATVIVLLFVAFCAVFLTTVEFVLKHVFHMILNIGA